MSRKPRKTPAQLAALARADEVIARRRAAVERVEVERAEVERLAAKTLANRRAVEPAQVRGPVVVTWADGSTAELPTYSPAEARRVIGRGQRQPRAWDDPGSGRYGGGNDFAT